MPSLRPCAGQSASTLLDRCKALMSMARPVLLHGTAQDYDPVATDPTAVLGPAQDKVQRLEAQVAALSERVAELHLTQASYRAQVETLQSRCAAAGNKYQHQGLPGAVRTCVLTLVPL